MEWIKGNLWEIKKSSALQYFGILLAFTHILTYILWRHQSPEFLSGQGALPLCWSFFPNCGDLYFFSTGNMRLLFTTYLVFGGLAIFSFFSKRLLGLAWFFLFFCFVFNLFFYLLDFSLANNTHAILLVVNFLYLFLPQKVKLIKAIVISYYVASGLLKLNPDWLAGFWLGAKIQEIPIKGIEWIAALMALIELIVPFGLISKIGQRFALTVVFLFVYQIMHWQLSGFFASITQLSFLIFFCLSYIEDRKLEREFLYQSFIRPEPSKIWLPIGIVLFWALQVVPHLNMTTAFDDLPVRLKPNPTPIECQQRSFVLYDKGTKELPHLNLTASNSLLDCHPFVRFHKVKNVCNKHKSDPGFKNVSSFFLSRSFAQRDFKRVFESETICEGSYTAKGGL